MQFLHARVCVCMHVSVCLLHLRTPRSVSLPHLLSRAHRSSLCAYHFEDTDKTDDVDGWKILDKQSNEHENHDNQVTHQPCIA